MIKNLAFLYNYNKTVTEWSVNNLEIHKGFLKGIIAVLCQTEVNFLEKGWQLKSKHYYLSADLYSWTIKIPKSYLIVIAALVDALYIANNFKSFTPKIDEVRVRLANEFCQSWDEFLGELEYIMGFMPPYDSKALAKMPQKDELDETLFGAIASVEKYLSYCVLESKVTVIGKSPKNKFSSEFGSTSKIFSTLVANTPPLVKDLEKAISRGSTALLVGPTGVGKTESVKAACLANDARLVKIEGHPGLDDRQLFGGTYPDGQGGFTYVEGPLTEAWSYAASGDKTVLLIDELARMDPYYHSIFIGVLDTQSGRELKARPRIIEQLEVELQDSDRYYLLMLPNGKAKVAPVKNLSLIATTNLGSDYQQATSQFDMALLGRFQLQFDVKRSDEKTRSNIIRSIGVPLKVAQLMVEMEDFTASHTAANGSLLREGANLRVLMNWGRFTRIFFDDGFTWQEALKKTASNTLIPFVCPRLSNGTLEEAAVEMLLDELNHLIETTLN